MMSESGVVYKTNSIGPNTEPCGTPNMTGEEEEAELLNNNALISVQKVRSKPLESGIADAKDSFETGKKNLVIDSIKRS